MGDLGGTRGLAARGGQVDRAAVRDGGDGRGGHGVEVRGVGEQVADLGEQAGARGRGLAAGAHDRGAAGERPSSATVKTKTAPFGLSISSNVVREISAMASATTATAAVVRQPLPNEATSGAIP